MLKRLALIYVGAAMIFMAAVASPVRAQQLIMVQEDGCIWCEKWDREIAPIYPKTAEGKLAPLRRIDLRDPVPGDLQLTSPPIYTPTFILVRDGRELARIEGYPGEAFFWGLLGLILKEHTDFGGAS